MEVAEKPEINERKKGTRCVPFFLSFYPIFKNWQTISRDGRCSELPLIRHRLGVPLLPAPLFYEMLQLLLGDTHQLQVFGILPTDVGRQIVIIIRLRVDFHQVIAVLIVMQYFGGQGITGTSVDVLHHAFPNAVGGGEELVVNARNAVDIGEALPHILDELEATEVLPRVDRVGENTLRRLVPYGYREPPQVYPLCLKRHGF